MKSRTHSPFERSWKQLAETVAIPQRHGCWANSRRFSSPEVGSARVPESPCLKLHQAGPSVFGRRFVCFSTPPALLGVFSSTSRGSRTPQGI